MSVSSAPSSRPVGRGTLRVNLVLLLVFAAVIAGLLVGSALLSGEAPRPRPATAPQPIAHDGLRLQLPRGWTRGDVVSAPGFEHPLRLRNGDAGLRANAEQLPATSPTLLPAALLATLDAAPEPPASVRMAGGRPAWRYRFPGRDGSMTLVYTAPTTSGIATVACTAPLDTSIPRACSALAAAVTVPGSRPLAPTTSAAFFSRLPTVVSELDTARGKGLEALDAAKRARGQALAADGLGRVHKSAAAALGPLTRGDDGVPGATVGALTATATAYGTLASAARNRLPAPYADARSAVATADARLRKAVARAAAAASTATRTASPPATTPAREPATAAKPAVTTAPAETRAAKPAVTTAPAEPRAATPSATRAPAKSSPAKAPKKTRPTERSATKPPSQTRAAKRPASKAPAKERSVERAVVEAPAKARPAATAAGGDLTLPLLLLSGAVAIFFAIRVAARALRSPTEGP